MKKYNRILAFSVAVYLLLAIGAGSVMLREAESRNREYKVEINRIMESLSQGTPLDRLDLRGYKYVMQVDFLSIEDETKQETEAFFEEKGDEEMEIVPYYEDGKAMGFYRFDYGTEGDNEEKAFLMMELSLGLMEILTLAVLLYLKYRLIVPFDHMSELPYELAKGHLKGQIKEEKSRFFGKFIWGISQLQDTLDVTKKRGLELEKQKKQLLLSLSHDIKTPLNTISLYAKALEQDVYDMESDKKHAAHQIGEKTLEIERYVEEIMKASKDDVLDIQVEEGEFYLSDLMARIVTNYGEKCAIRMMDFEVGPFDDRLLGGDVDRAVEVIENLIENAFKYGDGRRIEISFYEEDYCQLIRIFNTGEQISDNDFNHIFESFYRGAGSEGKQGNGLGLYICKEIMHKMDGEVFAEKEENGMAFVLVFR